MSKRASKFFGWTLVALGMFCQIHAAKDQPNVILIVCDDLNDYVGSYRSHPQVQTPNLDRFAQSAVRFEHAYSNNPVCAPSRASFLTGIYPHQSGNWFWRKWYTNEFLKNSNTIMEHFKNNGYHVAGTGKLMHHHLRDVWGEYHKPADYGPYWKEGENNNAFLAHPKVAKPFANIGNIDGSFGAIEDVGTGYGKWVYGKPWGKPLKIKSPSHRDPLPDEITAAYGVQKLKSLPDDQPFFLGLGFIRPHTPLHAPKEFFDRFPLDRIQLPEILEGDADDTFLHELQPKGKGQDYWKLLKASYPGDEGLRRFTQAYLACIAFVDDCIGQVLDALEKSPHKDNTIVVITSDHGWNMGEKDHLFKNSPWEESTRVPMMIRAPGVSVPHGVATHPVSLIDVYPTLVDLCDLRGDTRKNEKGLPLDGHSMRPFLMDPSCKTWEGTDSALSVIYAGPDSGVKGTVWHVNHQHYSLRTVDFRYIRYNSGQEELYDHAKDPGEHRNVAKYPEYKGKLEMMRRKLAQRLPENSEHLVGKELGLWK